MDKINFMNNSQPAINDTNLNLMQDNIENAISGVVENGSNENGKYIKFLDGTMICTKTVTFTGVEFKYSSGNLFFCPILQFGSTPVEFTEVHTISTNISNGWCFCGGVKNTTVSNFGTTQFFRGDNTTIDSLEVQITAIGRWK